jgi:hypothetical protein
MGWEASAPGDSTRHARDMRYASDMDREERQQQLARAEQRVAQGLAQIEKQRGVIEQLERDGRDATRAKAFFGMLLDSQALYEQHRDRMKQELERDA